MNICKIMIWNYSNFINELLKFLKLPRIFVTKFWMPVWLSKKRKDVQIIFLNQFFRWRISVFALQTTKASILSVLFRRCLYIQTVCAKFWSTRRYRKSLSPWTSKNCSLFQSLFQIHTYQSNYFSNLGKLFILWSILRSQDNAISINANWRIRIRMEVL